MKVTTNPDGTKKATLHQSDRKALARAVDVLTELAFKMDTDSGDLAKDGAVTLRAILSDPKLKEES